MRKDLHKLVRVKTMDITGERRLQTRGYCANPEALLPRQSMRACVPHYTYPRVQSLSGAPSRWLESQTGRLWADVYSDLKRQLKSGTFKGQVALERLLTRVETRVFIEDGIPRVFNEWGQSWVVGGLYVHPETATLEHFSQSEGRAKRRREAHQRVRAANQETRIVVSGSLQLHQDDNDIWYWLELAPITPPVTIQKPAYVSPLTGKVLVAAYSYFDVDTICKDAWRGREYLDKQVSALAQRQNVHEYGHGHAKSYAVRKWQASHQDIERYVKPALEKLNKKAA